MIKVIFKKILIKIKKNELLLFSPLFIYIKDKKMKKNDLKKLADMIVTSQLPEDKLLHAIYNEELNEILKNK